MTGATFGKLSQTRTSTGQCPTFAYIMKHSQATQELSHDVPNAYRKITHSGVAPKTLPDNGTHGHPKKQRHPEPNTSTTPSSNQVSVAAVLMMGDLSLSHYLPIPPQVLGMLGAPPTEPMLRHWSSGLQPAPISTQPVNPTNSTTALLRERQTEPRQKDPC